MRINVRVCVRVPLLAQRSWLGFHVILGGGCISRHVCRLEHQPTCTFQPIFPHCAPAFTVFTTFSSTFLVVLDSLPPHKLIANLLVLTSNSRPWCPHPFTLAAI